MAYWTGGGNATSESSSPRSEVVYQVDGTAKYANLTLTLTLDVFALC